MTKRKRVTPFCDDDFVYFELTSPNFQAFDHYNEGGSYSVPAFQAGVYRLPIDAICMANAEDEVKRADEVISVDTCQIFLWTAPLCRNFWNALI